MAEFSLRPFAPGDLALIALQPAQAPELTERAREPAFGEMLWRGGPAFTAWCDGTALASAGLREAQPHHAHAWAFLSAEAARWLAPISKAMAAALAACSYARVDMAVQPEFAEAHRWALMLGFEREARLRMAGPNGTDAVIYARIREKVS